MNDTSKTTLRKCFDCRMYFKKVEWEELTEGQEVYYLINRHKEDHLHGPFKYQGDFTLENMNKVKLIAKTWKITLYIMDENQNEL